MDLKIISTTNVQRWGRGAIEMVVELWYKNVLDSTHTIYFEDTDDEEKVNKILLQFKEAQLERHLDVNKKTTDWKSLKNKVI